MVKKIPVTQKRIAQETGVSQAVVSLVLNHSYEIAISEETRQRVLEVADALGYVPQAAAQALVRGRSANIGLALLHPHYQVLSDPFIPHVMTGISEVMSDRGYRLLVENIHQVEQLDKIRQMLKSQEIAGWVISNFAWGYDIIQTLVKEEYPIVLLDCDDRTSKIAYSVTIDHGAGVRKLIQHLLQLGHRRIACITYAPLDDAQVRSRFAVFKHELQKAGITFEERYLRSGNYDPETGYDAMRSILQERPLPTAVYGMNDLMALGAIRAIHEIGWRIPQDIAVVGYDDMRFAPYTHPPLTTIRAPEIELGRQAGKILTRLIDGENLETRSIFLETELVVRASCGA